jgi:hypothetical protein
MTTVRGSSRFGALTPATGSEVTTAPRPTQRRFVWSGRDISDAGMIAFTLGVLRKVEHGEAVIESSIELQIRPPRLTDAWRFFHAGSQLAFAKNSILAAVARQLGARIALAVSGLMVVDMVLAECGNSSGVGIYVEGHPDTPIVLDFQDENGRTVLDTGTAVSQADGAQHPAVAFLLSSPRNDDAERGR